MLKPIVQFLAVPWAMFVAAFIYYVALTLVVIGVEQVPGRFIAISYLAPVAIYTAMLLTRAIQAVPSGHAPHAAARPA